MIGTFWNLCRACPPIPIDKNRSEYRSTYQWYEYTGPRPEVVKQAPQLTSPTKPEENGLKGGVQATLIHINKRDGDGKRLKENTVDGNVQPELNIKPNPIYEKKEGQLDSTNCIEIHNRVTINPKTRLRSRNSRRDYTSSRRSKSEGPPGMSKKRDYYAIYGSPSPDHAEPTEFEAEYVLINNLANDDEVVTTSVPVKGSRGNTEYRLQFAWPLSKNVTDTHEEVKPAGGSSRRSAFMAAVGQERPPVPVHGKRLFDADKKESKCRDSHKGRASLLCDESAGAAESEPLVDQNGEYEHNEDPKDIQNGNGRIEFHSEYQKNFRPFSQYDYIAGKFLAKNQDVTPSSNLSGGSWYAEVIELRKKAGEYRHRGWGTELVPQHLAEVYNKQIALWEHVSRRSTLSALTLARTTQKPRALTKEEKSKENNRKFKLHEARQKSVERASSVARKKTEKNEEIKRHSAKLQKDLNGKQNHVETTSAPDSSLGRTRTGSLSGSPKKAASKPNSSSSPKKTNGTMSTVGPQEPRARPSANETPGAEKTAEPDIIEIERIVKSPPEPTRVKSPEQIMIKSPGPVNWTVPLDTGKTFTVTQNIPNYDVYHHRPPSEVRLPQHGFTHVATNVESSSSHKTDDVVVPSSSCDQLSIESSDKEIPQLGTSHLNGIENSTNTIPSPLSIISENEPNSSASIPSMETKVVKPSEISEDSIVVGITETSLTTEVPITDRISSIDVLDSGRNRFDQFWNKPTLNGKESSM